MDYSAFEIAALGLDNSSVGIDFPIIPGEGYFINANTALELLSGLGEDDNGVDWFIAVDGKGNTYVTGKTWSLDFPFTDQLFPCQTEVSTDAFITKVDTKGTGAANLLFFSCFGGSDDDFGNSIAVNNQCNVYLTGVTGKVKFRFFPI